MPLTKLAFKPGINREGTNYSNSGGWFDCDKIRFRDGLPERIGGWIRLTNEAFLGSARMVFPWAALPGSGTVTEELYGIGTSLKYYVSRGGDITDITPVRRTVTLGNDPFTTDAAGSNVVTVTDTAHGAVVNDFVTYSGSSGDIDGIPEAEFNAEHQIDEILAGGNTYRISTTTTATSGSVSGGGASVQAVYQINTGLDNTVLGAGWGTDTWGAGGWGDPSASLEVSDVLRLWSTDNFGEDLLINVRDGGIYRFDTSIGIATTNPAEELSGLSGSNQAPTIARQIMISNNDRHVLAFASDSAGDGTQDTLLISWSDTENLLEWELTTITTAGNLRLNHGSEFITAKETSQEILVWTDNSVHSMRFVGPPYTFGQQMLATGTSIIGPNAVAAIGSTVFWMGREGFYVYDGRVRDLPCSINDFIYKRINFLQRNKIVAGLNQNNTEIWWHYPSTGQTENDSYVIYNYAQGIWYFGTLPGRTFWIDRFFEEFPVAAVDDGFLYLHENGCDDGSTMPTSAISAFVESSDFEIGEGYQYYFMRRFLPDVTFDGSTAVNPKVTITLTPRDFPGAAYDTAEVPTITRSATVPVEQFDKQKHIRLRGRAVKMKIDSADKGVMWRQGVPRIDIKADGRR